MGRTPVLLVVLASILVGATYLRLYDLGGPSVSHPEIYVPGIPLPEDISTPPPRLEASRTLRWHFHWETHPPGYYFAMVPWVRSFGWSETALRLPSVVFGVGSVLLLFLLATKLYGTTVGLLSAALLAFNGHHLYWSQRARMYALGCFLGLLATLLLLDLARSRERSLAREVLYVFVCWLGMWTQIFFWFLLGGHIVWIALAGRRAIAARIIGIQSLVLMLGAPLAAHALYQSRPSFLGPSSLTLLMQYLGFGFIVTGDGMSDPVRAISPWMLGGVGLLAIVCLARSSSYRRRHGDIEPGDIETGPVEPWPGVSLWLRVVFAAFGTTAVLVLIKLALANEYRMLIAAGIPFAALWLPGAYSRWRSWAAGGRRKWVEWLSTVPLATALAFVPFLTLFVMSVFWPLLAPRGSLIFVPYLLIVIAVGIRAWLRRPAYGALLMLAVGAAQVYSIGFYREVPASKRDYKSLAERILASSQPGDLAFVQARSWVHTPLFYYLDGQNPRLVAGDFAETATREPGARIWLIYYEEPPTDERLDALSSREQVGHISERRAEAHPSSCSLSGSCRASWRPARCSRTTWCLWHHARPWPNIRRSRPLHQVQLRCWQRNRSCR
jgi:4-amino-4-deoxy-L-arabinose transferase-like glycosyltransferase